jgi:hypothetical protein
MQVETFCWFDDPRNRLFASFRTNLCLLEIKPEIKNRIRTHERAIVAARYLSRQKQVNEQNVSSNGLSDRIDCHR